MTMGRETEFIIDILGLVALIIFVLTIGRMIEPTTPTPEPGCPGGMVLVESTVVNGQMWVRCEAIASSE